MATCRSSRSSDAERVAKRSVLLGSFGLGGDNGGGDVVGLLLGLDDLDEIGHDLEGRSLTKLDGPHDLNLDSEHTLSEFDVTDGFVNEIVSGLSSGDLVSHNVLLGLGTLSTDLSGNSDLTADDLSLSHDGSHNVVSSVSDGGTGEELVLEGLSLGGGTERSLKSEGLNGEVEFVVGIVVLVSLLEERLDFLDFTVGLGEHLLGLGATDTDLGGGVGGADLNTGVTFFSEGSAEELVELSMENSVGNELSLDGDLLGGHSSSKSEDEMESGLLLDVVVLEGSAVFELLSGEDESLLIWGNSLLILDLGLDGFDGIGLLNLEGDGLTGEGLDEDLHSSSKSQDEMEGGLLLDVVVLESSAVFELLTGEDKSLLIWGNSFLVLDLGLNGLNGVGLLDFEGDSLTGEGLNEDLHSSSKSEDEMKGGLLLDVVVRKSSSILKLLSSEDKSL